MTQAICIGAVLLGMAALLFGAQALADYIAPRAPIKRKPFNCAECLTFWITWLALVGAAALAGQAINLRIVIDALIFAFINFFYYKSKIQVYE